MDKLRDIIDNSMDLWKGYLIHPFILGLADGSLSEEKFVNYLIEDTIYLREYARVYAMAMYKSHSLRDIRAYYSVLSFVNESESSERLVWLNERGFTDGQIDQMEPKKANAEYFGFMLDMAEKYEAPEILMAVLPCMFSYAYIFRHVAENCDIGGSRYRGFILGYASEDYYKSCLRWYEFAEEKCRDIEGERLERLKGIFRRSSEYEKAFWDMAFEG